MERKREVKGRGPECEVKQKRSRVEEGEVHSDDDTSLGKDTDVIYEDLKFQRESEYFPLAKSEKETSKKVRRYRGTGDQEVSRSVQEAERPQEHRKHRSEKERHPRSPPLPSSSSHKSHGFRRNASSGHNSPPSFEGKRSQEHQVWGDRNFPRGYQPDNRDEGYRHSRHPKDHYEGRRGSGGAPPSNMHVRRAQRRSRSPLLREKRHQDREEYERIDIAVSDGLQRTDYLYPQRQARRGRSPLGIQHIGSTDEESEGDARESDHRVLRHADLERFFRDPEGHKSFSESSTESVSDLEGGSDQRRKGRVYSGSSGSEGTDSADHTPLSKSKSGSVMSEEMGDKVSLAQVMKSKFDSDDDPSGEDTARSPAPPGPGPRLFTGYQASLSEEEEEGPGDEERKPQGQEEGEEQKKEDEAENQKLKALLLKELNSDVEEEEEGGVSSLPCYLPGLMGCRNVECYEWLNRIEEGTYGVVHRGKERKTGEIVALKKLKMEKEREGFPITSLREINMLLKAKHPNVVHVKEIVVGNNMDKIFIVMEYVEHDLKALMETMTQPFLQGEVKTLMIQLLKAVHHLHDNWILHRDLKASNLLLSHKGILKVGDFGLAREYGSPLKNYTPVVVTLWYRAPELLLGAKEYSTAVDMWSVGCIFAEFLQKEPLFRGTSEINQINLIFKELGTPNERIWPGYNKLPTTEKVTFKNYPYNNLRKRFPATFLLENGFNLLNRFLTYDPKKRISASDALDHKYFKEPPMPVPPSMFPTWPAKSEMTKGKRREKSPKPPEGGVNNFLGEDERPAAAFNLRY